eukprot:m.10500 g.10500  ORF g.10500 m.10500 type:complete len:65 (+) comp3800_c0_seq1:681-875(+)
MTATATIKPPVFEGGCDAAGVGDCYCSCAGVGVSLLLFSRVGFAGFPVLVYGFGCWCCAAVLGC